MTQNKTRPQAIEELESIWQKASNNYTLDLSKYFGWKKLLFCSLQVIRSQEKDIELLREVAKTFPRNSLSCHIETHFAQALAATAPDAEWKV